MRASTAVGTVLACTVFACTVFACSLFSCNLFTAVVMAADEEPAAAWHTDYQKVKRIAREVDKPIFLTFR